MFLWWLDDWPTSGVEVFGVFFDGEAAKSHSAWRFHSVAAGGTDILQEHFQALAGIMNGLIIA
jgi:hypothetical protein